MGTVRATKVLLIVDSPSDGPLAGDALETGGRFDVTLAERLREALTLLGESLFDVVLLDLGLPDAQGLEALLAAAPAPRSPGDRHDGPGRRVTRLARGPGRCPGLPS